MMSDEQLSTIGVCTIGDRLRLKAFCSPVASASKSRGLSKASEIQEKVEKVKEILNRNKRGKKGVLIRMVQLVVRQKCAKRRR